MLQQEAPMVKRQPIAQIVGLLAALALAALGYTLQGQDGAVLAAVGCAVAFAQVWRPTRVKTTERLYRVCGVVLRGDEETDKYFDQLEHTRRLEHIVASVMADKIPSNWVRRRDSDERR